MTSRVQPAAFTVERDCLIDGVPYAKGDAVDVQVASTWKRLSALMSAGIVTPSEELYSSRGSDVVRRRPTPRHMDPVERRSIVSKVAKLAEAKRPKRSSKPAE